MLPILEIKNLTVSYSSQTEQVYAVDCIHLSIEKGEIVGLAGQSGSGKSTVALAILNVLKYVGGSINGAVIFEAQNLVTLPDKKLRSIRGKRIAYIAQNPVSALDPLFTIGSQMKECLRAHAKYTIKQEQEIISNALNIAELTDKNLLDMYPYQLSGGMLQRVCIAISTLHNPALLIADEPTSSLDVLTQSKILQMFRNINRKFNCSILLISHDLAVLGSICNRIAIMKSGKIIDSGEVPNIFIKPSHEYTCELLKAIPKIPAS
jgi:ABC-type dipeptide/oligopeptide/nickel transport system ATPase component